ncbi:MAG: FAD-binding oxidoreductase, partial [Alphaproteobacteria bacterium]|nr:FAD-binding oxidoreductase [Alphaproteobacteria bacterium]
MSTERTADVVIVGGGIMGAATAFFLRRRGRSVILLERDRVGQHASGTNFGNVRRQGRFLRQIPLANRAREIWGRLDALIGENAEFLPSGHLRVCYRQDDVGALEQHQRDAREYGLELELLTHNALRARFPFLSPEAVAGSLSPADGHANPRLAAPAFARAARREGAEIHEGCEVLDIDKSGADFVVETPTGRFRAPVVQVSAGAWAGALAARFGENVKVTPRGPQMGVTEPVPYAIGPTLGVYAHTATEGIYLRQVTRGNLVFGGGARGPAFTDIRRAYVDPANTLRQLPHLRRLVPAVGQVRVIRTWSGIEAYLDDDIPVIGPSEKVSGLYYAFGFCGHGFALGPGVGDVMAELIATGRTTTPIEAFAVGR